MKQNILVAGAINHDTMSSLLENPKKATSNTCKMFSSFGGVGFNIARHLARLDHKVKMLTAVGDDTCGEEALLNAKKFGIDTALIDIISGATTGSYHGINYPSGELFMAFADMALIDSLDIKAFKARLDQENDLSGLVIDSNLSNEMVLNLLNYARSKSIKTIVGIGVCVEKMKNFAGALPLFNLLIVNSLEANALLDPAFSSHSPIDKAKAIHHMGVSAVMITLGKKGMVYADHEQSIHLKNPHAVTVVDTNGAGDAFCAGVIDGLLHKKSLNDTVLKGFTLALQQLGIDGSEPMR